MIINKHHLIDYIELPMLVDKQKVTISFYEQLFGWKFQIWSDDYISFEQAGIEGGFSSQKSSKVTVDGARVVLYSNDLDASIKAVQKTGASIVKPAFSFPGGKRFHFLDPNGNEIAIWSKIDKLD